MKYILTTFLALTMFWHCAQADEVFSTALRDVNRSGQHIGYILETGDDALLARLHLIRHAQESIDIQTFIWSNDDSGRFIFYEIQQAARRGVRVRLLVDDRSLRSNSDYVAYLATVHENIQLKHYNPLTENINEGMLNRLGRYVFAFDNVNQRMHNKIFIVDNRFAITGGRNYADEYFDRGIDISFKDRDLLIIGPTVSQMKSSFQDYWEFDLSVSSQDLLDVRKAIETGKVNMPDDAVNYETPAIFAKVSNCADSPKCMQKRIIQFGYTLSDVEFVVDKPGKGIEASGYSATTQSLIELFQNTRTLITMQTPYLVLGKQGQRLVKKIRKSTPEIEMIVSTNSLAAADHFYAYAFSYKNKKNYLKKFQWQIHELKPRPPDEHEMLPDIAGVVRSDKHFVCIHAKTFLFDNKTTWLGSFNLDPRSASLNTEAGLIVRDSNFTQNLRRTILRDIEPENSWTIGVRQKIPVLAFFTGVIENIFSNIPFLNVWPFRFTTSFELKTDGNVVPFHHEDFYENYRSAGQFPGINLSVKATKTRLTKAFFGPAEPIM